MQQGKDLLLDPSLKLIQAGMAAATPHMLLVALSLLSLLDSSFTLPSVSPATSPAASTALLQQQQQLMEVHQHQPLSAINVSAAFLGLQEGLHVSVSQTKLTQGRGEWVDVEWNGLHDPRVSR